ncbi:MAG: FAD-dependent oxidoreductase [Candidatus Lokiarchaeota archaeon]|nr:FAD-dependent oxidoreductase [Candidatus Lokiarchaeota archaeon]
MHCENSIGVRVRRYPNKSAVILIIDTLILVPVILFTGIKLTASSAIVIGAGISGLSAGIYARLNGYDVTVFESHSQPGGVAACWKRGEYLFDGGIHFLPPADPNLDIYDLYLELGLEYLPTVPMNQYCRFTDIEHRTSVDITDNLDDLQMRLLARFPEDTSVIYEILSPARSMSESDTTNFGFDKPSELMGIRDKVSEIWQMRGFMRFMFGKYALSAEDFSQRISNPVLRDIVKMMFLPEVPIWFISMILGQVASGQIALLENGSISLVSRLVDRLTQLGGKISYRSEVKEILIESDRAVGIRLEDESQHRADYIIPAMDMHSIFFSLLGGKYVSDNLAYRFAKWDLCRPILIINYGVAMEFSDEPWLNIWKLDSPIRIGTEDVSYLMTRIFNYGNSFAPSGKTVIQVELETDWDYWYNLHEFDMDTYQSEKERIASEVADFHNQFYEGFKDAIEVTDVSTPFTMWRYTKNYRGAYMGWLPASDLLMTRFKKKIPGLANCFLAGQWAMGMGGVLPAIYSGRQAIQLVCSSDGRPFQTIQ